MLHLFLFDTAIHDIYAHIHITRCRPATDCVHTYVLMLHGYTTCLCGHMSLIYVIAYRRSFKRKATLDGGLELLSTHKAADGTCKMLFKLKVSLTQRVLANNAMPLSL